MQSAERYNISDDTRTYITEKRKFETQKADYEQQMIKLRVLRAQLMAVTAQEDGYVTEIAVKEGEAFDAHGDAYSFCPQSQNPVLRIDTSDAKVAISRGTDVVFDSARGGTVDARVNSVGVTTSGDTYADVELSRGMIRDLGGSCLLYTSRCV